MCDEAGWCRTPYELKFELALTANTAATKLQIPEVASAFKAVAASDHNHDEHDGQRVVETRTGLRLLVLFSLSPRNHVLQVSGFSRRRSLCQVLAPERPWSHGTRNHPHHLRYQDSLASSYPIRQRRKAFHTIHGEGMFVAELSSDICRPQYRR